MCPASEESTIDFDKIEERTRHTVRDPLPDGQATGRAESDIALVGALFGDRRESEPRPNSLDFSEEEEAPQDPLQVKMRAELLDDADAVAAGNTVPSRSPSTPTPTHRESGSYIQESDILRLHEQRRKRDCRGRRHNPGSPSENSRDVSGWSDEESNTSNENAAEDESAERGRSMTPTPYFPQSYTPSHYSTGHSDQDHGEGQGPLSPHPYSAWDLHNAQQQERTAAIEGVDKHFPVDEQPRAE